MVATTHHEELAGRFVDRLLARGPESVLDVGCGGGFLLARCRAAGVRALGLEAGRARLVAAEDDAPRLQGHANALPLPDASVDWVTLRHVPHHLEDPAGALAEAWRVARSGVLVAEPWFDVSEESQAHGHAAEAWLKRCDRRRGMFHAENHSAGELIGFLPEAAAVSIEAYTALRTRTAAELEELGARALGERVPEAEERAEWERLLELARKGRVTQNGTLMVTARKGPAEPG